MVQLPPYSTPTSSPVPYTARCPSEAPGAPTGTAAPGKPAPTGMADIVSGAGVAAAVSFAGNGLRVLGDGVSLWPTLGAAVFRLPMGFSLALLGAGYLIGIVAGLAMPRYAARSVGNGWFIPCKSRWAAEQ